jgi:hypothetical protein
MMAATDALTAPATRRLSSVQWNRDGRHGLDVRVREDVPVFDEGMIRRALLRGALVCTDVDGLSLAINHQLWLIGYVARVQADAVDRSVVVEVSKSRV